MPRTTSPSGRPAAPVRDPDGDAPRRSVAARLGPAAGLPFTPVPTALLLRWRELGMREGEAMLAMQLLSYKWGPSAPHPSLARLARLAGMRRETVRARLYALRDRGLVRVLPTVGRTHRYDLTPLLERLAGMAGPGQADRPGLAAAPARETVQGGERWEGRGVDGETVRHQEEQGEEEGSRALGAGAPGGAPPALAERTPPVPVEERHRERALAARTALEARRAAGEDLARPVPADPWDPDGPRRLRPDDRAPPPPEWFALGERLGVGA